MAELSLREIFQSTPAAERDRIKAFNKPSDVVRAEENLLGRLKMGTTYHVTIDAVTTVPLTWSRDCGFAVGNYVMVDYGHPKPSPFTGLIGIIDVDPFQREEGLSFRVDFMFLPPEHNLPSRAAIFTLSQLTVPALPRTECRVVFTLDGQTIEMTLPERLGTAVQAGNKLRISKDPLTIIDIV